MTASAAMQSFLKSSIFLSDIFLPHSRYQSARSLPVFGVALAGGGGSVGFGAVVSLPVAGGVLPLSTCSSDFFLLHAKPAATASASTRVVRILIQSSCAQHSHRDPEHSTRKSSFAGVECPRFDDDCARRELVEYTCHRRLTNQCVPRVE